MGGQNKFCHSLESVAERGYCTICLKQKKTGTCTLSHVSNTMQAKAVSFACGFPAFSVLNTFKSTEKKAILKRKKPFIKVFFYL